MDILAKILKFQVVKQTKTDNHDDAKTQKRKPVTIKDK
jgi:hypothetical protein